MSEVGEDSGFLDVWADFGDDLPDPPAKRPVCDKCLRPSTACWCPYLPREPLSVHTTIYILQHPFEERKRSLQTGIMLKNGLAPGKCRILQGKRFSLKRYVRLNTTIIDANLCLKRYPELESVIANPNTILVFPGPKALDLNDYAETCRSDQNVNLIMLDGTWAQAKGIYNKSPFLHHLTQVQLSGTGLSEYVIRTQPNDSSLSTLETAAIALSAIEKSPTIRETLVRPLRAMCDFQIKHGAVRHQSKQYLIDNGLYKSRNDRNKITSAKS
ncbi:hypothetical protein CAPTEDRAFT_180007 [Capitella teleta]|uniref:tRNA-uridine aminocarboxypropyltransferase n=1 Tax=Capitella teleta TaxID=283909 RepID=R7TJJ8_CAPTE|nr:hypothetical protein CAPTEDRAFT_180007 [Capitella teleta]|eukprot:ELT93859.1 hypothetical protein CAPTEDRAFT_180007 [Capitella teleta]